MKAPVDFSRVLRPFTPGIVCLVGGGGKTSLLYALGKALGTVEAPALCTTTTRILPPTAEQCPPAVCITDPAGLEAPAGAAFFCAAGPAPPEAEKLAGFRPEGLDRLRRARPAWTILVEADGAAGRPVKAPRAHEPVIPASTRAVVAVLGLSGLRRPLAGATVFRLEETAAVTGLAVGEELTPAAAARLFTHPRGLFRYTPAGAAKFVFLNQADLPGAAQAGFELAETLLRESADIAGVFVGAVAKEGLRCARVLP